MTTFTPDPNPSPTDVGASMSAAELLFLGEMASFLAQSEHSFDRQRGQSLRKLLGIHAARTKAESRS